MKVAVIGAGVIGVTMAYELTLDGHEVTVFERRGTAAEEASFASGSLVAPGWLASRAQTGWPNPRFWPIDAGLGAWPGPGQWAWLWRWQRAHRAPQQGQAALFQLAQFSHERLAEITTEEKLEYDRSQGLLVLWRTDREAAQARANLPALRELGVSAKELDAAQVRLVEPALNPDTHLSGAVELSNDSSANCRQFTLQLKNLAQARGCDFQFGCEVVRLNASQTGVTLTLSAGQASTPLFDAAVLCAGGASAALLRPLGVQVPTQTVWGHSISAAVREPLDAPLSAVMDARHQVSITRIGQRVRVAGGTNLRGERGKPSASELRRLYRVLMDWFPGAARLGGPQGSVQEWQGAQTLVADGLPLLGESGAPRIWLNLAHGSSGWTLACGCARALADRIRGQEPVADLASFSPLRHKS
ncbi:MAG: FAD-dependent oxidoreductase [Hydrogenophaga sp.]|nr:FAD-dependent oxidoreductase [Hydrogenophaga sp.]